MNSPLFETEAQHFAAEKLAELRKLSFRDALNLPGALAEDIVIAGKEVQLTIFRQQDLPILPGAVLVTVQLARAGLGGRISYHYERALVYFADGQIREATQDELAATGG